MPARTKHFAVLGFFVALTGLLLPARVSAQTAAPLMVTEDAGQSVPHLSTQGAGPGKVQGKAPGMKGQGADKSME